MANASENGCMCEQKCGEDVAAIITAMTNAEQLYVRSTVDSVPSDPGIGQVILCIEQNNTWVNAALDLTTDPQAHLWRHNGLRFRGCRPLPDE